MEHTSRPVVAYCDGSASSLGAALWAVEEALDRRTWLHLVAVTEPHEAGLEGSSAATRRILRSAAAIASASNGRVLVKMKEIVDDPAAALVAESHECALMCLGFPRVRDDASLTRWVLGRSSAPVALVGRRHAYPHPSGDRWIVAVIHDETSAQTIWGTTVDEARARHAAVMVLTPPGVLPDEEVVELHRDCDDVEIWLMPGPVDVAAVLSRAPYLEHTVVVSADQTALINEIIDPPGGSVMPTSGIAVVVVPVPDRCPPSADLAPAARRLTPEGTRSRVDLALVGSAPPR